MPDELAVARTIQDSLFEISRGIREGGQEVQAMAFMLVPNGEAFSVIPFPVYQYARTKAEAADLIQQVAQKTGARFVIHTTEAWMAGSTDGQTQAAAHSLVMMGGTLEDLPGRLEILLSFMDGPGIRRNLLAVINDGVLGETQDSENTKPAEVPTLFGNLSGQAPEGFAP